MKVLLKQSGNSLQVVQIGAISTDSLPEGTYLLAKVKETLVIRNGGASVKQTVSTTGTANAVEPVEQPKQANFDPQDPDYSKPTNPIHNFKVGSAIWIEGERFYYKEAGAPPIRFKSAEEPLYVGGKLFNGTISVKKSKDPEEPGENVYNWTDEKAVTTEIKKPSKEKKKKVDNQDFSDILSGKVSLEDLSKPDDDDDPFGLGPAKPKAKAKEKVKEEEFNDFGFLNDIGDAGSDKPAAKIPEKNETYMEGDLTIFIVKEGKKYRRDFKTETACKNAFNLIKGLIGNDENITQMLEKFTLITQ